MGFAADIFDKGIGYGIVIIKYVKYFESQEVLFEYAQGIVWIVEGGLVDKFPRQAQVGTEIGIAQRRIVLLNSRVCYISKGE